MPLNLYLFVFFPSPVQKLGGSRGGDDSQDGGNEGDDNQERGKGKGKGRGNKGDKDGDGDQDDQGSEGRRPRGTPVPGMEGSEPNAKKAIATVQEKLKNLEDYLTQMRKRFW